MPVIVADIMFLHERGKFNTLYFATYFGSLMIGPIIAGPMTAHIGWRSFWWLNVALCGATLVLLIFAFPETRFHRPDGYDVGKTLTMANHASSSPKNGANTPGGSTDNVEKVDVAVLEAGVGDITKNETNTTTTNPLDPVDPWLGRGTPAKWQWKLWQPYVPSLWKELLLPIRLLLFPIIEFAAFGVSWTASAFLTVNLTQSQAFAAPPYNFSSETIGFFNFAVLIGAMIGLFTAGPLSDYVAAQLTRRNRGIREPEMRLLTAIPYVVLMVIGNVITAVGYDRHWHWALIVVLGWTCTGIQVAALPAIFSTYAVDSYKPVAGAIFVAITVNKNVWGYGFSRFITAWAAKVGFITPIMTNMALTLFFCSLGIVFWFYGKTFRRWTKDSNVHHEKQL
jgi:MFS family permease